MYGVWNCMNCEHEECEVMSIDERQNAVICIPKKKKNLVHVVK